MCCLFSQPPCSLLPLRGSIDLVGLTMPHRKGAEDSLEDSLDADIAEYVHNRSISVDWKEHYESIRHDMADDADSRAGSNLKALERMYSSSKNGPRKRPAVRPWVLGSTRGSDSRNDEESPGGEDVDEHEMRIRMATIKGTLSKLEEEVSKLEARKQERHNAALRMFEIIARKRELAMESMAEARQRAEEVKALLHAKHETSEYLKAGIEKVL